MFQKDLISIHDLAASDVAVLFSLAARMKASPKDFRTALSGKILAMIFEKSSTRTRVSFEAGMTQLGGAAQFLSARDIQIGRGEPISDTARVLSRYVDGIMARTFAHDTVVQLARHATIPIINGLTDLLHPCQALTDYFTMSEKFGALQGLRLAYVGDGNNMAHSLMYGGPKCGVHVAVATPPGYEPDATVTANARADAAAAGTTLLVTHSREEAVAGAHVVYTDVWPRWARRPSSRSACATSRAGPSRTTSSPSRTSEPSSCTASRRTAARKCRPACATAPVRSSSTRRRTASTSRRRSSPR